MNTEEIKQRVLEIEETYKEYIEKLFSLKKKQDTIINDFENTISSKRIEEIKKSLGL